MWNYGDFKRGSFVELVRSPAVARWGINVYKIGGATTVDTVIYPPMTGIIIDIFIDDISQKYADVVFSNGMLGRVFLTTLNLVK